MWNHAPTMHSRAQAQFPIFGPGDMGNLVAYLFAKRYFYEEGDPGKGSRLFQTKSCAVCHEQRRKQVGAPDLDAFHGALFAGDDVCRNVAAWPGDVRGRSAREVALAAVQTVRDVGPYYLSE